MVVSIPVSALSQKIILREHGAGIISLNRSAGRLSEMLRVEKEANAYSMKLIESLSCVVQVDTNDRTGKRLHQRRYTVGLTIHRFHMDQMIRFIWSLTIGGMSATNAMRQFYLLYNLTEDDISEETAYRQYERWRKSFDEKNPGKFGKNWADDVVKNSRILRLDDGAVILVTESELEQKCNELRRTAERYRLPQTTIKIAQVYLHHIYGRKADRIAQKFGRHRSNIYAAIDRAKGFMQYDATFRDVVSHHLPGVLSQPAAAAHL